MLLNCSTLFAYQVKVTKLTDENFDPLPKEMDIFSVALETYNEVRELDDKQIATITLVFEPHEIGQDEDAVDELAKKEALKLGANMIVYISDTQDKNTEDIASATFRCVRTYDIYGSITMHLLKEELRKSSLFYYKLDNKLYEVKKFFNFSKYSTPDKALYLIGARRQQVLKEDKKITVFHDIKTNKQLEKDEICKRWLEGYTNEGISVYKDNLDLYIAEYDKIIQIGKKYFPEFNVGISNLFPKPDAQKNINFKNLKDYLLPDKEYAEIFYEWCLCWKPESQ